MYNLVIHTPVDNFIHRVIHRQVVDNSPLTVDNMCYPQVYPQNKQVIHRLVVDKYSYPQSYPHVQSGISTSYPQPVDK